MTRLILSCSATVVFQLSIVVYARLTGNELGFPRIVSGGLLSSILFFLCLSVTLGITASAFARTAIDAKRSSAGCMADAAISGVLLVGLVIAACWVIDGNLNDLPQFVRFEVALVSGILAPLLAVLSYLLSRRRTSTLPATGFDEQDARRWYREGLIVSAVLVGLGISFYAWDNVRPWREPMLEQLLVAMCALTAPAFTLAVLGSSRSGDARIWFRCGAIALVALTALL